MKKIQQVFVFVGLFLCIIQAQAVSCRVVDGDTLACGKQRIRLANVYAAEIHEPGGIEAKQRLSSLVRGQNITIQSVASDKYGRTVAQVFVNGRPITQTDIGPRLGRGSEFGSYVKAQKTPYIVRTRSYNRISKIRVKKVRIYKTRPLRNLYTFRAPRQSSHVRTYIKRNGSIVSGHRRRG
jgi:hypothetical protein